MRKSVTIRNKVIPIWLLGVIVASIFVSIVVGAYVYQLTIPGTVVVEETEPANYQVEAYEDFECTKPLTNINFGTMRPGEHKKVTIYLKNTGDGTIFKIEYTTVGTGLIATGSKDVNFKPGDVISLEVPISIASDATAGSHSVTVTLKFVA